VGWRAVSVAGLCHFVDADAKELMMNRPGFMGCHRGKSGQCGNPTVKISKPGQRQADHAVAATSRKKIRSRSFGALVHAGTGSVRTSST
jgi:hypothetical protein